MKSGVFNLLSHLPSFCMWMWIKKSIGRNRCLLPRFVLICLPKLSIEVPAGWTVCYVRLTRFRGYTQLAQLPFAIQPPPNQWCCTHYKQKRKKEIQAWRSLTKSVHLSSCNGTLLNSIKYIWGVLWEQLQRIIVYFWKTKYMSKIAKNFFFN